MLIVEDKKILKHKIEMTKNKFFSIFAIMAIAIVSIGFFFSCSDVDLSSDRQADLQYKGGTTYELFDIYNPSNPFDIFGVRHNIYLDKLGNKLNSKFGVDFYKKYKWSDEANIELFNITLAEVFQDDINQNNDSYNEKDIEKANEYINNPQLLSSAYGLSLESLFIFDDEFPYTSFYDNTVSYYYDMIKNTLDLYASDSTTNINQVIASLSDIENEIISKEDYHHDYNEMLNNEEEMNNIDHLLGYLSILKHSLVYWNNASFNKSNPWNLAFLDLVEQTYNINLEKGLFSKIKDFLFGSPGRTVRTIVTGICVAVADAAGGFTLGPWGAVGCSGMIVTGGILFIGGGN